MTGGRKTAPHHSQTAIGSQEGVGVAPPNVVDDPLVAAHAIDDLAAAAAAAAAENPREGGRSLGTLHEIHLPPTPAHRKQRNAVEA